MDGLSIRDYEACDREAVLSLNAGAWEDQASSVAQGAMDAADLYAIESVYLESGVFLIAVADDVIVGMVGLQRLLGSCFELRRMRVDLSQQGRGIGRALTQAAEAKARSLGARRIVLNTTVQQTVARHLYESMGFQPKGASVLEDRHGRFDVVHYEKVL